MSSISLPDGSRSSFDCRFAACLKRLPWSTTEVAEQASGLCVTCGGECSSCHPLSAENEAALQAEAHEVVGLLAEAGMLLCPQCQGRLEAHAE